MGRGLTDLADDRRFPYRFVDAPGMVRITTRAPWAGRQVHLGILQGFEDDRVCIKEGQEVHCIPLSEIAKARLDIDLKNIGKEA